MSTSYDRAAFLSYLFGLANRHGIVRLNLSRVAEEMMVSRRALGVMLNDLESAGRLVRWRNGGSRGLQIRLLAGSGGSDGLPWWRAA
jgi:hypothetical protein